MSIPKRVNIKPKPYTHTGTIVNRYGAKIEGVKMRQTNKLWLAEKNYRFDARDGRQYAVAYSYHTLDLTSIKPIAE